MLIEFSKRFKEWNPCGRKLFASARVVIISGAVTAP
jgi:hypothetical protein